VKRSNPPIRPQPESTQPRRASAEPKTADDRDIVRRDTRVRLHLEIRLEDGTEAISTFADEPLELSIGDGTLVAELERALLGLRPGSEAHFPAHGDDLYGPRTPDRIHWLDRKTFPEGFSPAPGQVIAFDMPGGHETGGTVVAVDGNRVQVDFNHPLAGRLLQIRVEVLAVSNADRASENP
jgi:FKBP-type peptidyl-prolyl cis-trans isomerase SlpA